jgi:hypothetical protein
MDQYKGTYYVINKYGNAVSTPICVIDTRRDPVNGYMVLADKTIIKATTFIFLIEAGKLVRERD